MPEAKPRFIDPPQLFRSPRYTNVVVANGFAFIAGQTAFDAQGNVLGVGDFCAQADVISRAALDAVGARAEYLVEVDAIVALPKGGYR